MASKPVLDFSSQEERPVVAIDRIPYQLRILNDLTIADVQEIERLAPQIAALLKADRLSKEDDATLSTLLERACDLALAAPADVQAKLSPVQRSMIFKVFSDLLSPSLLAAGAVLEATMPISLAGATSSPKSSGSTAARRRAGSKRRRSG